MPFEETLILEKDVQMYICVCVCMMKDTCMYMYIIPYSWKFSRDPIFAAFTVDWQTMKIKSAK